MLDALTPKNAGLPRTNPRWINSSLLTLLYSLVTVGAVGALLYRRSLNAAVLHAPMR
jgi:hypothetical protein